jgi:hypothetical protein
MMNGKPFRSETRHDEIGNVLLVFNQQNIHDLILASNP